MKHVILSVIIAVTLPVFAADQTAVNSQQPAPQPDSPLVAAAKRANRLGKKPAMVITNDTLVRDGRGFTTTSGQQEVTTPKGTAAPTPEMTAASAAQKDAQRRAEAAAQQKKAQDMRSAKAAADEAGYENDNYLNEDPARHEHAMEVATQPAQPTQPQQSSNNSQPQQSQSYSNQKPPQN